MPNNKFNDENPIKVILLPQSDETIELTDDDGNELMFFQIALIDYNNDQYVMFQPAEEVEGVEDDEVIILKMDVNDGDQTEFITVDDEELLDKLFEEYLKAVADLEYEDDDDDEDDQE